MIQSLGLHLRRSVAAAPRASSCALFTMRGLSSATSYENIIVQKNAAPRVALITLNRPKALNALCTPLMNELNSATAELDLDPECGAIVITGSEKAFAAGADIKEMAPKEYIEACKYCVRVVVLSHSHQLTN